MKDGQQLNLNSGCARCRDIKLELKDDATTTDFIEVIVAKYPKLNDMISKIVLALNQEYLVGVKTLKENDEVALIPPVSGG